ncbi:hypothetical protein CC1G_03382 [Coprinopsis cinerea okayama7|uniref:DUF6534 domain-containing protein n=1 Tax=Coprinopsis cinerea (strain Okayama-7 / 130 / ATCC MYA-4618 / FGSC 9003) TaxID=240176 RepID=A8NR15_COPC7|nr:hypothetical protein CC1G_03382 [Coprinopsis cinerea okayama7\|eukprot:XP_001835600.2 hypothetical protein CC1G_03382 [Coprinopsis cinerea okayama7\
MFCDYFRTKSSKSDGLKIKIPVIFTYIMDIAGTVGTSAIVGGDAAWLASVAPFSDRVDQRSERVRGPMFYDKEILGPHKTLHSMPISPGILPLIGGSRFFLWVSKRSLIRFKLGMSIVLVVFSEFHDRLGERYLNLRFAIACLGLSVLADFSITACLLYALYKPKILSPETRMQVSSGGDYMLDLLTFPGSSLIRQLAVIAVQTGCAPSFVAATCLIILCVIPETLVSTAFSMSIGCVYTCTMLFTLNKRAYLRGMNSWIHTTPYPSPDDLAPHCFQDDEESGSMKFARPPEVHTGAGSNSSWDRRIETSPRDALLRSDSEPETHLESPPSAKLSFSQHSPLYVSASPTSVASRTAPLTHP